MGRSRRVGGDLRCRGGRRRAGVDSGGIGPAGPANRTHPVVRARQRERPNQARRQHGAREQFHCDRGGDIATVYGSGFARIAGSRPGCARPTSWASPCTAGTARSSVCGGRGAARTRRAIRCRTSPAGYVGYKCLVRREVRQSQRSRAARPPSATSTAAPSWTAGGNPGFPGFDGMTAANTLGYVAQMQEAGIPVTFAYISDVHDSHAGFGAYGPGEAGYVAALRSYDDAFGKFVTRLAARRYRRGQHALRRDRGRERPLCGPAGAQDCDGVNVPCIYNAAPGLASPAANPRTASSISRMAGGCCPFKPRRHGHLPGSTARS